MVELLLANGADVHAKTMRGVGMMVGPGHTLAHQEFRGRPHYRHFRAYWDVYQAAMIMVEAGIPPWLIAHAARIRDYDELYGRRCRPLLYRQHNRFLKEHMPRMMRRETERLDKALARNSSTDYDPAEPWGYLFMVAVSPDEGGAAEHR